MHNPRVPSPVGPLLLAILAACSPGSAPRAPSATTLPRASQSSAADSLAIDSIAAALFARELAPGMALAVVRGDEVLYLGGFGFADREAGRRVTPETIFYIASTTKAFTGLAAAILHQRGRFDLDAPLSRYLRDARLAPPLSADSITIRSLLSHTHGISNDGPIVWRTAFTGEFTDDAQLVQLLAEHPPARDGRTYEYGNIGYNVAGFAMGRAVERSWRDVLAAEIFAPLELTSTSGYVSRVPAEQLAMPYGANGTGFDRVSYGKTDANMQAAGGLVSSAGDMARWLEAQLNGGRVDGRQALPAAAIAEAQRLQATASGTQRGLRLVGYSLGWQLAQVGADTLYVHGGGFTGFATHVSFLPTARLGVAVMANEANLGSALVNLVALEIHKRLAGAAVGDALPQDVDAQLRQARQAITADRARRAARSQVLPYPLEAYAGTYVNPTYGTIELRVTNGRLEAQAGAARSAVEVFDATRNQLRVELSGSGGVMQVDMQDGRARALTLSRQTFLRQ